mgnify:CR=1 FL=1
MIRFLFILFFSICYTSHIEKLSYKVYFTNLKAGTAELKLSEDANGNHYIVNFELRSYKYLDAIYKLRENTSMIVNRKDFSIYEIKKHVRQGRKKRSYNGLFDYDSKIAHINSQIVTFQKPIYDPINIIYYIRNNMQLLKDNIEFSILSKNTFKNINMGIIEEEEIIFNNKKYVCSVVGPINNQEKLDDIKIWFTKDSLALPLIIEKKAKLGTIKMELVENK